MRQRSSFTPFHFSFEPLESRDTPSAASFIGTDWSTAGSWQSRFGADGYILAQGPAAITGSTQVTVTGDQDWTWDSASADPRALAVPGASGRLAACWYSPEAFTVAVDLPEGESHQVSAYFLDWDARERAQRVEVLDAATGAVLDHRDLTAFQGGVYLSWDVTGDVRFRVTALAGPNAVLDGLFLDTLGPSSPSTSAAFVGADTATRGSWAGQYGSAGFALAQDAISLPAGTGVTWSGQQSWVWDGSTTDPRALQRLTPAADRLAACWYGASFTIDIDLTAEGQRRVSAYFLDWDAQGRAQRVEVLDAATGAVLDHRDLTAFQDGVYLSWDLSGHVQLRLTNLAGANAVLGGLFFEGEEQTAPSTPSEVRAIALSATSAQLNWVDNATTEAGYLVERSTDGTTFSAVATVGANATEYTDAGLAPMTTYYYRIRAFDAAGNGQYATANVTTPARVVAVGTTAELRAAVRAATPGTRILVKPGTYEGDNFFSNVQGEADRPIVIAAQDPANKPIFSGGGEALHFSDPAYLELRDLVIQGQYGNGLNIDDADTYDTPAHHILLSGLVIRDVGTDGNEDGIKLSGVQDFRIENTSIVRWGGGGSGIDMVGCHDGVIEGSYFAHSDDVGGNGIEAKGGSTRITIRGNWFDHASTRAIQIGGATGLNFFRPQPPTGYEAADCVVEQNVIVGSQAAITFASSVGSVVRYNTIYRPTWYAIRILRENYTAGFIPTRDGVFTDNIVVFRTGEMTAAVNVGSGTAPETFQFARNWWYAENNPVASTPSLPSPELAGTYGVDPQFVDPSAGDLHLRPGSPAGGVGAYT